MIDKSYMKCNCLYADKIYNFIIEYKYIILISFFVGVFSNVIDIFTVKYGLDAEFYALSKDEIYFNQQRYGSLLFYHIIPFARYHMVSQLTGIMALTLAGLLTISRHNIPKEAKLLFTVLFVTFPNFAFLQYFYFQSAYNFIALLFVVISYRIIENSSNIFLYIISIVFLIIGISSYQANFAVFLSVMMINIILDYIVNKNYTLSIKQLFRGTLFLIVSMIIYYILIKILSHGFSEYHSNFFRYKYGVIDPIVNVLVFMKDVLFGCGYHGSHTANLVVSIVGILFVIYILISVKRIKKYIFLLLLIFLFILAMFSVNILLGNAALIRVLLAIAFYPALIIMLLYYLNIQNKLKYIAILLTLYILVYHTTSIVKHQTISYMTYQHNEYLARDIISRVYDKYPDIYNDKYKIAFYGSINTQPKHPLLSGKEDFGYPFFSERGLTARNYAFIRLQGFPMNVEFGNITDDMKKKIELMPSYPNAECIKLFDDTVVVKLSD